MTDEQLDATIVAALTEVAPDADVAELVPDRTFRDQFDFDSVDFLTFALGLEKKLGLKIPELDYPKLSSLRGCREYLQARAPA